MINKNNNNTCNNNNNNDNNKLIIMIQFNLSIEAWFVNSRDIRILFTRVGIDSLNWFIEK